MANSASGIQITTDVINQHNSFRQRNTNQNRYIMYKLSDDFTEVVVAEKGPTSHNWSDFVSALPKDHCRYATVLYEYQKGNDGERAKIVFVLWTPDNAPSKEKMLFASTKNTVKQNLQGINIAIQATDIDEAEEDIVKEKCNKFSR
mmetsp:Transcript_21595/g.24102  ORF Transcript_21595/g.24102 Transcript_21595/m.24102 type:complete len:146 (+) Transcript_21595:94-531(+)|eukprot:CAMPEP_0168528040 /NCGR_PEP_ID=MMETSP0405-20121227/13007_1 /TAXON_ID=498012 /ORGANISM="Trichosphaerium sp, Strain Am-I-7 wt" /LENGTH=145 /DNA_ID=CAMNT_0008551359 /DNA_START=49 /DNA_END=486 /DNA_ORIENTATION=+